LCHCCPLEDWESSLPFVLVFPCDLQEHCLYLAWFKVGSDLSVWLGEIICHRWLFEQLLVPSVRHIARAKLSLDPTVRRSGKPPHHLPMLWKHATLRIFSSLSARPALHPVAQSFQPMPQPTRQEFVTPQQQMIPCLNLFQTPTTGNQSVQRTPTDQNAT
jgi:hypothetical protein